MEQTVQSARVLRFAVFEADLEAGELRKNDRKVSLQEQPFQVLVLLLLHSGKLVTREELQKQIWPADTFVDFDLGLNTAIKKIRAALGDSADKPKFVETLPRRGYRFICPVEQIGNSSHADTHPSRVSPLPIVEETTVQESTGAVKGLRYRVWLVAIGLLLVILLALLAFDRLHSGTRHSAAEQPVPSIEALRLQEQGTRSAAAYQAYLRGRDFLQAYDMPEKNDHAIQAFRQALQADPSYGLAYAGLGEASWKKFEATKDDQWSTQAQNDCVRALELDPNRAAAHLCQATLDYGAGQYDQALQDFSAAIKLDPRNADAYRGRGWAYLRINQPAQAEKDYLQAIQCDLRDWRGYSAIAQLYLEEGRYDDAVSRYEQAIAIKPDNSELRFSLGVSYIDTGQYDKAVLALDEAVKLRPTFGAYENAGTILLNGGRFPEAIQNFKKAIELEPGDYRLYGNLARAYFWAPSQPGLARENYARAITIAEQQLKVNTNDPDVNLSLAIYHAMLGQREDAFFYLDRALQLQPDTPETAFWAGVVHLQSGNRAKALVWLRKARALKYSAAEINAAPELEKLHDDPQFQRLMAKGTGSIASNPGSKVNRSTQ